ncbi:hypothetical protein Tco_0225885, partial [Tanacetum coccineum]
TPNTLVDMKDSSFDEILDDLFKIGAAKPEANGTRKFCRIIFAISTSNVPDVMDDIIQPLIPKTIHTIPLGEDYVTPATKTILDELLKEFADEILNVTMVDEEADFNPTKDIEKLERFSLKILNHILQRYRCIQLSLNRMKNPDPFVHT